MAQQHHSASLMKYENGIKNFLEDNFSEGDRFRSSELARNLDYTSSEIGHSLGAAYKGVKGLERDEESVKAPWVLTGDSLDYDPDLAEDIERNSRLESYNPSRLEDLKSNLELILERDGEMEERMAREYFKRYVVEFEDLSSLPAVYRRAGDYLDGFVEDLGIEEVYEDNGAVKVLKYDQ